MPTEHLSLPKQAGFVYIPGALPKEEQERYATAARVLTQSATPQTETEAKREIVRIIATHYRKPLFNATYAIVRERAAAEDGLQQGLSNILRFAHTVNYARPILPWARVVVENAARVIYNANARFVRNSEMCDRLDHRTPQPGRGLERELGEQDLVNRVLDALQYIPPQYAEALRLFAVEDLTHDEIAARLNVPTGTVKSRLHRAREELRKRLPKEVIGEVFSA